MDLKDNENLLIYSYKLSELSIVVEKGEKSQFDLLLEYHWNEKKKNNYFRYSLDELESRLIPGKYRFIAQLNIKRAIERRKPQFVSDVAMKFDETKFHFGKVDSKEILFQLKPLHWEENYAKALTESLLIINVSPLEYCNSLLVPSVNKCYPQVLNLEGMRLALETVALSHNPDLKLGMNSLGAFASVNHLHFHLYYLKQILFLQYSKMKQCVGDCYEIQDFPAKGFAFQLLEKDKILETVKHIMKLIEFLQTEKIAYNIFITRGKAFYDSDSIHEFNAIGIFIWARKSVFGSKDDVTFNPAVCELAGHLPIKEKNYFESVTEEEVENILKDVCQDVFLYVKSKIKQIYL